MKLSKLFTMKWKLINENGKEWIETHADKSLEEIEIIYGDNIHGVIWMQLRMKGRAII